MASTSKNISIVFDTSKQMIEDKNLKLGMVVETLGLNSINDDYGAVYKIMECPNQDEPGENNFVLKYKTHLRAVRINSSNNEQRLKTCEVLLSKVDKVIGEGVTTSLAEIQAEITNFRQDTERCNIIHDLAAKNVGVRLVLLGNGQKAIVVQGIISEGACDSHLNASISGDVVTITMSLNDDVKWASPSTLELLDYTPATVYVNENCSIEYTAASESVPASLKFVINRQLNPAVYYYM